MNNSFMERIQTKVEGIGDLYEVGKVYVKEDKKTRDCTIYTLSNRYKEGIRWLIYLIRK